MFDQAYLFQHVRGPFEIMTTIKKPIYAIYIVNKSPIPTQNLWVSMSSHTVLKSKKKKKKKLSQDLEDP